jgi:hypothetical protein
LLKSVDKYFEIWFEEYFERLKWYYEHWKFII